jgi:hypothetical protein
VSEEIIKDQVNVKTGNTFKSYLYLLMVAIFSQKSSRTFVRTNLHTGVLVEAPIVEIPENEWKM